MNAKLFATLGVATMAISVCSAAPTNEAKWDYTNFKAAKPSTVLVVMPTSKKEDKKVATACLVSAVLPLSDAGYYPIPVTLAHETLNAGGSLSAQQIRSIPLQKLAQTYGADAVMYIDVENFSSEKGISSVVTSVTTFAKLVDLKTGNVLWQNRAETTVDSNAAKSLVGYTPIGFVARKLGGAVATATSKADYGFSTALKNGDELYATEGAGIALLPGPKAGK